MIEFLTESQGNVLGVKASGTLKAADYENVLIPRLDALFREYGKLRVLFYMSPEFSGWELGAAWDDLTLGVSHRADFEKIAVVGGPRWIETCIRSLGFLLKGETKTFREEQLPEAWEWVNA